MSAGALLECSAWSEHDLLGVGFGPSNLALAIALFEHNADAPARALSAHFLERQARLGWHSGMLIDGALMQVPFLKDLATLRNPVSQFSFVSYLTRMDRLSDFINRKSWFPSRVEFNDYLEWAAAAFAHDVDYGCNALGMQGVWEDGVVTALELIARRDGGGPARRYRARNLVISTGLEPCLPGHVVASERIWHNSELVPRVDKLTGEAPNRIIVVGAGQSAAETAAYLHSALPGTEVWTLFSQYGYRLIDDSPYANRIFDHEAVDAYYQAPDAVKETLLETHANTSYSVVDLDLIKTLYDRVYQERVIGASRLRILDLSEVVKAHATARAVSITIKSLRTGDIEHVEADALVFATGYRVTDPADLLGELRDYCEHDSSGRLRVQRDYRVVTSPQVRAGLYLQGPTEHTHGISSSLLSNVAVRAGEIVETIANSCHGHEQEHVVARSQAAMRPRALATRGGARA
jgi:L-ornithine N5-monooxygenase